MASDERAAVVAWLRGLAKVAQDLGRSARTDSQHLLRSAEYGALECAAIAIERGDHMKGAGDEIQP